MFKVANHGCDLKEIFFSRLNKWFCQSSGFTIMGVLFLSFSSIKSSVACYSIQYNETTLSLLDFVLLKWFCQHF